jgi:O-antigen/teichoic acid export membrane protein
MFSKFIQSNNKAIIGWLARAGGIVLSFVNTRLLIEVMGVDGTAAYTIILSITPWIGLLNLGLPITMQNEVSRLRSNGQDIELMQKYAFGTMILLGIFLVPVPLLISWATYSILLNNYTVFSLSAVTVAVMFIYLSALSQLMAQLMYANNDAIWPTMYPVITALWIFIILILSAIFDLKNINLIFLALMLSNILLPIHAAMRVKLIGRVQFNLRISLNQIKLSKDMLIFSMIATAVLSVDYMIMARMLDSVEIVKYSLASKLFMTFLVFHGVLIALNWTLISDSINSKKMKDARLKIEEILKFSLTIAVIYGLIVILYQDFIFENLTGNDFIKSSNSLMGSFLLYVLLRIWTDTYAVGLQGCGKVKLINIFLPFQAVISCLGQYYLGGEYGAIGIVWGMILSFILTAAWIVPYHFYKITNKE